MCIRDSRYAAAGAGERAEVLLQDRLKVELNNPRLESTLAMQYLADGKADPAIAAYEQVLASSSGDAGALNNLAWLYQQKGNLKRARELAERALVVSPQSGTVEDTLGWILLAQGETDKAVAHLIAANDKAHDVPTVQYHLAVALQRVGRTVDARTMLEGLLGSGASFADKPAAEKLLAELKQG